jgi:hypothetical protein
LDSRGSVHRLPFDSWDTGSSSDRAGFVNGQGTVSPCSRAKVAESSGTKRAPTLPTTGHSAGGVRSAQAGDLSFSNYRGNTEIIELGQ